MLASQTAQALTNKTRLKALRARLSREPGRSRPVVKTLVPAPLTLSLALADTAKIKIPELTDNPC